MAAGDGLVSGGYGASHRGSGDQIGLFSTLYFARGPWTAPPISGRGENAVGCRSWVNTPQQTLHRVPIAGYLAWSICQFVCGDVVFHVFHVFHDGFIRKERTVLCGLHIAGDGLRRDGRCGRALAAVPADARG